MFEFIWRIGNFSMLTLKSGEFLDSPPFKVKGINNVEAYVRMFFNVEEGRVLINFHVLKTVNSADFIVGTKIEVTFIYNENSRFRTSLKMPGSFKPQYSRVFTEAFNGWDDLFRFANDASVHILFTSPHFAVQFDRSYATTIVQIERYTYDVLINELEASKLTDKSAEYSTKFSIEEYSDSFQLVLKVNKFLKTNTVEIEKIREIDSEATVCYEITLFRENYEFELLSDMYPFRAGAAKQTWRKHFDIDDRLMKSFRFLRFKIIISIGNVSTVGADNNYTEKTVYAILSDSNGLCSTNITPPPTICIKSYESVCSLLKAMYETEVFSDVTLHVGTNKFPAHKCVLSSASDVFAAMFRNKMQEQETNTVHIIDIDSEIMDKLLHFIYLGKIENVNLKDLPKLYSAADKYQIKELKKLCSSQLQDTLSMDTVFEILEISDMHQDDDLRNVACGFIRANRKMVFNSDSWKCFMGNRLEFAAHIMLNICKDS